MLRIVSVTRKVSISVDSLSCVRVIAAVSNLNRAALWRRKSTDTNKSSLLESTQESAVGHTRVEKVKEAGKNIYYGLIISVGVCVTGFMLYLIGKELLSTETPTGIFAEAAKMCDRDDRVIASLGPPIKSFGELNSRGRRRYPVYVSS